MPGNLQEIPMSAISAWPAPNYIDPVRRDWMTPYAATWQIASGILVGARYWLRITNKAGGLGLDDALLLPGLIFSIMFTILAIVVAKFFGADRHMWDVPPDEYENLAFCAWLAETAFLLTTTSTKISVLLFYRRLTAGTFSKRWKWATWLAMLFTALQCFTFMFALGFNCKPVEAYWKAFSATYTVDYHCSDTRIINPISGAMSVFSDAYAVALPMMMMRHFEMDIRKKIALNFVFSLGLIVVGAGIGRTYYLTKLGHSYDITWTAYDVLIWTQIEINFSLICASAPVLRILVRRYLREPMSRVMTANSHNRSGARSAMRNSLMTEPSGIGKVTYTPHRDSQDWGGNGDKNLIRHSVKPSLDTVKESARSTTPRSDGLGVKDIEAYAMSALKSSRPTSELTSSRPMSPDRGRNRPLPPLPQEDDASMQASLSEPFSATPWYGPNAAWHERHEKQG